MRQPYSVTSVYPRRRITIGLDCVPTLSSSWDEQSSIEIDLCLFCWFWFCFLGFPSERITHFFFHLDEKVCPAGYRCVGDISMIKALIEAQIAGESRLLTIFPQKCPDQLFKQYALTAGSGEELRRSSGESSSPPRA